MSTPKTQVRAKRAIKARRMFTVTGKESCELYFTLEDAQFHQQMNTDLDDEPYLVETVLILPATPEAYEAMVEQGAATLAALPAMLSAKQYDTVIIALLKSIGITSSRPLKQTGKK